MRARVFAGLLAAIAWLSPSRASAQPLVPQAKRVRITLQVARIAPIVPGGFFDWRVERVAQDGRAFDRITRIAPGRPFFAMDLRDAVGTESTCARAIDEAKARGMQPLHEPSPLPMAWQQFAYVLPGANDVEVLACLQTMEGARIASIRYGGALWEPDARILHDVLEGIQFAYAVREDAWMFAAFDYDLRGVFVQPNDGKLSPIRGAALGIATTFYAYAGAIGGGFRSEMVIGWGTGKRVLYALTMGGGPALRVGRVLLGPYVAFGGDGMSGPGSDAYEMRAAWNGTVGGFVHVPFTHRVMLDLTGARTWRFDIGLDARPDVPNATQVGARLRFLPWRAPAASSLQGYSFGASYADYGDARAIFAMVGLQL